MLAWILNTKPDSVSSVGCTWRLVVARAGLLGHGLSLAHTHVRLNATQIHNAARLRLGLDAPAEDPSRRRVLLAAMGAALDEVDRHLLTVLSDNARSSVADLARQVGMSAPAVRERIVRLEQAGVIRGYRADIDPAALGKGFEVEVMVELTHKDRATVETIEARLADMDEVVQCRRLFGVPDYLMRVAVADVEAYEAFYMAKLAELPGIGRVTSQFTMKLVKQ